MDISKLEQQFVLSYSQFLESNPARVKCEPVDPDILSMAKDLHTIASTIEEFHGAHKLYVSRSKTFLRMWRSYKREWSQICLWRSGWLNGAYRVGWPTSTPESLEDYIRKVREHREKAGYDPHALEPINFSKNPEKGAMVFRHFISYVENIKNEMSADLPEEAELYLNHDTIMGDPDTNIALNWVGVHLLDDGLKAIEFFENRIGFNVADIFFRWKSLPVILIPSELGSKKDEISKSSLYGLLKEAILAYVAGATIASIAMCRSALEIVLKEYYLSDCVLNQKKNNIANLINIAVARYDVLADQQKKMHELRQQANRMIHNYSIANSKKYEQRIVPFFLDIKHWIELAPERRLK